MMKTCKSPRGNLNDFPIVTRSASKGSSSNTVPSILKTTRLDKSRHLVVVLPENSDPNPCLAMDTLGNPSMSDNTLILGNPPDTRKNLPPNPVAFVSRQDHAKSGTNMVEPVETYEDFVYDFGLRDMEYNGPDFTCKYGSTQATLDRFLCNSSWDESHPESSM
ncbi:hypothetical protein V6N13_015120 [Hibiscus sabdariffa]